MNTCIEDNMMHLYLVMLNDMYFSKYTLYPIFIFLLGGGGGAQIITQESYSAVRAKLSFLTCPTPSQSLNQIKSVYTANIRLILQFETFR